VATRLKSQLTQRFFRDDIKAAPQTTALMAAAYSTNNIEYSWSKLGWQEDMVIEFVGPIGFVGFVGLWNDPAPCYWSRAAHPSFDIWILTFGIFPIGYPRSPSFCPDTPAR
jgi:hypothetical protein